MYTEELKQIVKNIATPESSIGYSKRTLKIKPYYNQIYQATEFLERNERLCARLYCILNNIIARPKCQMCGINFVKYEWLGGLKGFKKYCADCQHKSHETKIKTEQTMLYKYGAKNISQTEHFKNSFIKTMRQKYGVDHPMHVEEIKSKVIHTCLTRHGYTPLHKYINMGKNEELLLNEQESIDGVKIQRTYRVDRYYVDGYCPNTNTVYEVYETFHRPNYKKAKDKIRQRYIQEKLKCTFTIIWDEPGRLIERFPYNTEEGLEHHTNETIQAFPDTSNTPHN